MREILDSHFCAIVFTIKPKTMTKQSGLFRNEGPVDQYSFIKSKARYLIGNSKSMPAPFFIILFIHSFMEQRVNSKNHKSLTPGCDFFYLISPFKVRPSPLLQTGRVALKAAPKPYLMTVRGVGHCRESLGRAWTEPGQSLGKA